MSKHIVLNSVKVAHPQGFSVTSDGTTLIHGESGASVAVNAIDRPYNDVLQTLTAESLAKSGMQWLGQESVAIDGRPGRLLHLAQLVAEVWFIKWVAVFGRDDRTYLVTAAFPRSADHLSAELRELVLDALWTDQPSREPAVSVDVVPPLAFCREFAGQLIYTCEGRYPASSPDDPIFVIGRGYGDVSPERWEEFSRERIAGTVHLNDTVVSVQRRLRIDGMNGCETIAEGQDRETGRPMAIYQVLLFLAQGYFICQGLTSAERRSEFLPVFQKMTSSLRRGSEAGA